MSAERSKQKFNDETLAAHQPTHCTVCQPPLGRVPTRIICPRCKMTMLTKVERKGGCFQWCFYLFPCFVDSFEETTHFCSNCNAKLGTVKIPRL